MNYDEMPCWGISCNFQEFMIFDFNNKHSEPERIKLADLPDEFHRLDFLVAKENIHIRKEVEISNQFYNYEAFVKKEPAAKKYIKRLMGAVEYINNKNAIAYGWLA